MVHRQNTHIRSSISVDIYLRGEWCAGDRHTIEHQGVYEIMKIAASCNYIEHINNVMQIDICINMENVNHPTLFMRGSLLKF